MNDCEDWNKLKGDWRSQLPHSLWAPSVQCFYKTIVLVPIIMYAVSLNVNMGLSGALHVIVSHMCVCFIMLPQNAVPVSQFPDVARVTAPVVAGLIKHYNWQQSLPGNRVYLHVCCISLCQLILEKPTFQLK